MMTGSSCRGRCCVVVSYFQFFFCKYLLWVYIFLCCLLYFCQLLGVAIRADVPVALDLLPCFWKSLREEPLTLDDIKDADWLTYSHTQRLLEVRVCALLEMV